MMMYTFVHSWIISKTENERGAGLAEYALLLFLIAVAVFAALTALGDQITALFEDVTTKLGG